MLDIFTNMIESFDKNKKSLEEAYCLANIIKLNYNYLDNEDYDNLRSYIERLEHIMEGYDADFDWCKDIKEIIESIKKNSNVQ